MNALAATHDVVVYSTTVDLPDWLGLLILLGYAVVLAIAAREIYRATRRKGPPPLPRP